MRNRNLAILLHSGLRLRRLLVGHPDRSAGVRPNITNEVQLMNCLTAEVHSGTAEVHPMYALYLATLRACRMLAAKSTAYFGQVSCGDLLGRAGRLYLHLCQGIC